MHFELMLLTHLSLKNPLKAHISDTPDSGILAGLTHGSALKGAITINQKVTPLS